MRCYQCEPIGRTVIEIHFNDLTINWMSYFVMKEIDLQIGFILDCKVECHLTKCLIFR